MQHNEFVHHLKEIHCNINKDDTQDVNEQMHIKNIFEEFFIQPNVFVFKVEEIRNKIQRYSYLLSPRKDEFLSNLFFLINNDAYTRSVIQIINSLIYQNSIFLDLLLNKYNIVKIILHKFMFHPIFLTCLINILNLKINVFENFCNEEHLNLLINGNYNSYTIDIVNTFIKFNPKLNKIAIDFAIRNSLQENNEEELISLFNLLNNISLQVNISTLDFNNEDFLKRILFYLSKSMESKNLLNSILRFIHYISSGNYLPISYLIDIGLYNQLYEISQQTNCFNSQILAIISNIASFGSYEIDDICNYGFIDLIYTTITNGTFIEQIDAISLVSNILYKGTIQQIRLIINPVIFDSIALFLQGDQDKLINLILESILYALNMENELGLNELKSFLYENNFLEIINELKNHENDRISELSIKILNVF